MKKPNGFTLFIGNPLVALIIVAVFAYTLYQAATAHGSAAAAGFMAVLAVTASNAYKKANDYFHWEREWNLIGGQAPKPSPIARNPQLRGFLGAVVFNLVMVAAIAMAGPALKSSLIGWCGFIDLALIGVALYRLRKPGAPRRNGKDATVTVCLPIPKQSPDFRDTFKALPAYCFFNR